MKRRQDFSHGVVSTVRVDSMVGMRCAGAQSSSFVNDCTPQHTGRAIPYYVLVVL